MRVLLIVISMMGCASKPSGPLTVEDEKRMTVDALTRLRQDFPPLKITEVQTYVDDIGQRLVRAGDLDGRPYRFSFLVIDTPGPNAFALPAGKIYVSAPLLAAVETEAELAGVLGHEIGHVIKRHASSRIRQAQIEGRREAVAYGLAGGIAGGALAYGLGQTVCMGHGECGAYLALGGISLGVSAGLGWQKDRLLENSLENETAADAFGNELARKAGYSPAHAIDFYARIAKKDPQMSKRRLALEALGQIKEGRVSSPEFARMKSKLLDRGNNESLQPGR